MGDFVHKTLHMVIFIQLEYEIFITEISSRRFLSNFLVYKAKLLFQKYKKMEPLNIPHLADETLIGGSFQTPILEDVTYGQRDNSRLFHTREDDSLPFHYYPRNTRKKKILASCSNDKFGGCKAKFSLISKDPQNTVKVERPGKKHFLK